MKVTPTKKLHLERKPGLHKREAYLSGTKKCEQFYNKKPITAQKKQTIKD